MTTQYLKRLGVWHSYFLCLRRHLGELVPTLLTLLWQLEGEVCISPIHRQVSLRKEKLVWGLQGYLLAIHAPFLGWQGTLISLPGSAFSHPQSLQLPWGGRAGGHDPSTPGQTCDQAGPTGAFSLSGHGMAPGLRKWSDPINEITEKELLIEISIPEVS